MTQTAANTDREIWREKPGEFYSDSIHVTECGAIGINVGGLVIVKPAAEWHRAMRLLDKVTYQPQKELQTA